MLLTLLDFILRLTIDVFNVILTLARKAQSSFLVGSATTMTAQTQSMNIGEQDRVSISIVVEKKPNAVHLQDEAGGGEESASVESEWILLMELNHQLRTELASTVCLLESWVVNVCIAEQPREAATTLSNRFDAKTVVRLRKRFECESQGVVRRVLHMSRQPYKIHESFDNFRVCLS